MLTADELAAELQVAPKTVRARARRGQIPGEKLGPGKRDQWRFDLTEVRQAMKANRPLSIEEQARQRVQRQRLRRVMGT